MVDVIRTFGPLLKNWNYFCEHSRRMEQRSSELSLLERGHLRLSINISQENLVAFVCEASHLKHPMLNAGPCSIFVEVSVISKDDSSVICQTKEVVGHVFLSFNEIIMYQILPGDRKKRLWITVWCKDSSNGQTDLIGGMSFGMKHLQAKTQKEAVEGWFCLLLESVGRRKHMRSPMSEAYVSDGNEGGQLPFDDVRLHSMMPLKMTMPRHPTGFGFTIKGSSLVCVGKVDPNSSAETAGLAPGDYIESVNGKDVSRLSAESVAAIITSIEYFLTLGIYRQNHGPKRYPVFEQDENHYILLWEQGAKKTSLEYVDANSRMIKRGRVDLMRTFRSQVESTVELDYDIFVRQECQVEEAIYEEIDECLPMAPPRCSQRDDIFVRQKYQVKEAIYEEIDECLPMAPPLCSQGDDIMSPASGVSSTAVSVPSEPDRGYLVPRHASNNGDKNIKSKKQSMRRSTNAFQWHCMKNKINVTSNSNEMSDGIDNEAFLSDTAPLICVTSNSNEMSDGIDNAAFLSDTAT